MESVGLDTGFFIKVFEGNEKAVQVWRIIVEGELKALTSSLVLFELRRLFHKLGRIEEWDAIKEAITLNCEVVPVNLDIAESGADISHGTGLPAVDALIYASVMNVDEFYTTDRSFEILKKKSKPHIMIL